MTAKDPRGCSDLLRIARMDRRSFVKAGILGTAGLSLAELLRSEANAGSRAASTSGPSVIILWMRGGPSHIDMWDPKPDAAVEYRGLPQDGPTSTPAMWNPAASDVST